MLQRNVSLLLEGITIISAVVFSSKPHGDASSLINSLLGENSNTNIWGAFELSVRLTFYRWNWHMACRGTRSWPLILWVRAYPYFQHCANSAWQLFLLNTCQYAFDSGKLRRSNVKQRIIKLVGCCKDRMETFVSFKINIRGSNFRGWESLFHLPKGKTN